LLITVRNKARSALPRPTPNAGGQPQHHQQPQQHTHHHQQHLQNGAGDGGKGNRRRDRRRRAQAQQMSAPSTHYAPPQADASARPTGIGAWLPPESAQRSLHLEFRVHVRQGGLTVTVLAGDVSDA
jgi:hypothetical protein